MRSEVVYTTAGRTEIVEFDTEQALIEGMEALGFPFTALHSNPRTRAELQNKPKFQGVAGPMWGGEDEHGPRLRYECSEIYRQMSV